MTSELRRLLLSAKHIKDAVSAHAIMMNMFKALLSLALCGSGAALDIDYYFGAE